MLRQSIIWRCSTFGRAVPTKRGPPCATGCGVAPREEMLYINLARIHVRAGDRPRARGVLEQLLAAVPESETGRKALEELTRP